MDKVCKWIDKIYASCSQLNFKVTPQEHEQYLQEATKKNKYSFNILVSLMFVFEFYNMFRVLFLTKSGLGTLNNQIYFMMYAVFFISGVIYLIFEYCMRNNAQKLNILYMGVCFSWYLWHIGINYYDLTKDPTNGTSIYMMAIFICAIFFQCKPAFVVLVNVASYMLFSTITYDILDTGVRLNLAIIVMMATVISIRRYFYLIQSIRKNNELLNMSEEIQRQKTELQISARKQKAIMKYTNDVIIEWDFKKDVLNFSNNVQNKFLFPIVIKSARTWLKTTKDIHPEDVLNVRQEIRKVVSTREDGSVNVRIRGKAGFYIWYQARIFVQSEEDSLGTSIIGVLADIDKQQRQMEELVIQSSRDSLTGLYNKVSTEQKIEEVLNDNVVGTMYMIDIDNFKAVNDTLGHAVGDKVIVDVANTLKEIFYKYDVIGRVGGDEFMVFCSNLVAEESIMKKAQVVLQSLEKTYSNGQSSVQISASVGIYIGTPEDKQFKDLYKKVDVALYKAKEQGKNQFCFG